MWPPPASWPPRPTPNIADDPERSMLLALAADRGDEVQRRHRAARGRGSPAPRRVLRHASCSACPVSVAGSTGVPTERSSSPKARRSQGSIDVRDAGDRRVAALVGGSRRRRQRRGVLSNDGSMLATVGDDGALRIWDPATGDRADRGTRPADRCSGRRSAPTVTRAAAVWNDEIGPGRRRRLRRHRRRDRRRRRRGQHRLQPGRRAPRHRRT